MKKPGKRLIIKQQLNDAGFITRDQIEKDRYIKARKRDLPEVISPDLHNKADHELTRAEYVAVNAFKNVEDWPGWDAAEIITQLHLPDLTDKKTREWIEFLDNYSLEDLRSIIWELIDNHNKIIKNAIAQKIEGVPLQTLNAWQFSSIDMMKKVRRYARHFKLELD